MWTDPKVIGGVIAALGIGAGAFIGKDGLFVTRTESECAAHLAAAEARLELGDKAIKACTNALDAMTGTAHPPVISGLGAGCVAYADEPTAPESVCPPCPCADDATRQAIEAARAAIQQAAAPVAK